jgi:superkiller protein 3
MGNLGRTLEEVLAAINFDPSLGDAYWVRGIVRLRMGAVKDSLSDLNKALKLNPARTEAYAVIGDCYEQLRQIPEAVRAYRTALERDPNRGEWWYRLARMHADSGNRADGESAVKRALELGDKAEHMPYWLPDAYRIAGEIAESKGDRNGAIRNYKRYREIATSNAIDRSEIEKKLLAWGVQLNADE